MWRASPDRTTTAISPSGVTPRERGLPVLRNPHGQALPAVRVEDPQGVRSLPAAHEGDLPVGKEGSGIPLGERRSHSQVREQAPGRGVEEADLGLAARASAFGPARGPRRLAKTPWAPAYSTRSPLGPRLEIDEPPVDGPPREVRG